MSFEKNAIMIFGPTASGKTSLGIELANKFNGVIINADSRQIYTDMDIISSMPSEAEFSSAEHKLFRFLLPTERYNAGQYLEDATKEAEKAWQYGKLPIFLGGTGFYLKMLEEGISQMPDLDKTIEEKLQAEIDINGSKSVHDQLTLVDPIAAARIHVTDPQRIIRALGLYQQTGKTLTYWQSQSRQGSLECDFYKIALCPEREILHQRIEKRLHIMEEAGVEQEIKALYDVGLSETLPALKGLGIPEFYQYFRGEISKERALEATLFSTRQYARRQITWMNNSYHPDMVLENAADFSLESLPDWMK